MVKVVYAAFLLMIAQGIFTWFQVVNYRKTIRSLKDRGVIGVGMQKGRFRSGKIVILVSNELGEVIAGKEMQGITIFARFKDISGIKGKNIFILKEESFIHNKKDIALITAVNNIEKSLNINPD
ncbi:MAG: transcriptional regulator GutM [Clostridiaceae bacterium]